MTPSDEPAGEALQTAVESVVLEWPDVTAERLFGFPAYRAAGGLFAVLDTDGVALTRLPPDARERLTARYELEPIEAYGQTIKTWDRVTVGPDGLEPVLPFVRESYEAARSGTQDVPPPEDE